MLCVDLPDTRRDMSRRRSMVWGFFRTVDESSVQCLLCRGFQSRYVQGSTTAMLRHLRAKHPKEIAKKSKGRTPGAAVPGNGNRGAETDSERYCFVEVLLEDEDPAVHTTVDKSAINGILESAQEDPAEQQRHGKTSDDHSVRPGRGQRSLIWRHFERLDCSNAARCRICMRKLQCSDGSTSNLHRHMSKRHPEVFAKLVPGGLKPPPTSSSQGLTANGDTVTTAEVVGPTEQRQISVDMLLEDEDPDIHTTVDESDISSAINGILDSAQEDPAEQIIHGKASDDHSLRQGQHQRSLIWRHFERLDSLNAARCRICMRKLQCFEGGSTCNLHRHMSKRHPEVFAKLVPGGLKPPPTSSSQGLTANGDTTVEVVGPTEQRQISGVLKVTRPFLRQKRVLKRDRELIEALRRTQKEEARALEHQRELLEKLRAANAREAAAEREEIESLRKAQQEEAKELNAQREELQREKAELQNKWEELQLSACTI